MYMHGNAMVMDGTDFAMNLNSDGANVNRDGSLAEAGQIAGDLARLLLLTISAFKESASEEARSRKPSESNELKSVWSWLKSWTTQASAAPTAVDINMHMY